MIASIHRIDFDTMENSFAAAIQVTQMGVVRGDSEDDARRLADAFIEKYRSQRKQYESWEIGEDNRYPKFGYTLLPELVISHLDHACAEHGHAWSVTEPATATTCGWALCPACGARNLIKPGRTLPQTDCEIPEEAP